MKTSTLLACAAALLPTLSAAAEDARPSLNLTRRAAVQDQPPVTDAPASTTTGPIDAPLTIGGSTRYWSISGGGGADLESNDDSRDFTLVLSYHHFLTERVEFIAQLDTFYFAQEGDEALGFGPSIMLRWHYYERGRFTAFLDAGLGVLFSTDDVPTGGTSFNFTPRAGAGATWRLSDDGARLVAGIRWHHISNARIDGDSENPDRDGIIGYVGVMFPF